ncbi:hypothetical protein [Acinetobacter haemolyticus]|uniref:Peptide signal n=1 Tax=Acinetobacter haemolyticus TaxID=29430 RepID=A0AAJ2YS42_ACIHA|nr:hypothetical protein [Acinetobacter haemolyticus]NAR28732.1 hypothetical protein [Acinetobacter haemolyticus]NAR36834.1 hypothetical protein [Acinetobacter haemolyticus]NAR48128.1 hypothetical protein [Acinetobacter haemolyticus]NAR56057.1 hypothetical protein [Acinetobacter haemolyticus]NAR62434.1 hypothetical protein [Acinetobacter haemolyticus]
MNFLKRSACIAVLIAMGLPTVQANDVVTLPTIKIMAESELREEVGFIPFQEDEKVREALQHHIYKVHSDMQNAGVNEGMTTANYQPKTAEPDLSQLSPILQQYILAVARGFQSSDPTTGVFKMLEPLNIDRNNIMGIRDGTIKINMDDILKLQKQIEDGLRGQQNQFFMP